jgi:hypothetical protein
MKVRIVIEYDNDGANPTLEEEKQDWLNGDVDLWDIVNGGGGPTASVRFEEIKE